MKAKRRKRRQRPAAPPGRHRAPEPGPDYYWVGDVLWSRRCGRVGSLPFIQPAPIAVRNPRTGALAGLPSAD